MPNLNYILPEGERINSRINRILYAEYIRLLTEYEHGTINTPPSFKGDTSFFLRAKLGSIDTEPLEQKRLILSGTPPPTPPSPSSIQFPFATSTTVTINWPPSRLANSYKYILNGVEITPVIDNGLTGSITLSELLPGSKNTMIVITTGPSGTSHSLPLSIYSLPKVALTSSYILSAQTDSTCTIGWSGSSGITSYSYTLRNTSGKILTSDDGILITDNGLSSNSVSFSGLVPASQYSVVITGNNPSGSLSSNSFTIFTAPAPPSSPIPNSPTINSFTIPIPSTPGAVSHTYKINNEVINPSPAVPGYTLTGGNITFTGLTPGIPQNLHITAIGFTGLPSPSSSTIIYTTPVSLPSSSFLRQSSSPSSISLSWPGANSGATSYTYTVLDSNQTPISGLRFLDNGVSGNAVTIDGLSPGIPYTVLINAKNPSQENHVSSESFTVYTAPAAASNIIQNSSTQTSASIRWGGATGATSYLYMVKDASDNTLPPEQYSIANNGMANSSALISGLSPGKIFKVIVIARDIYGQTSSSPIPIYTLPSTPTAITETAATQTSFTVTWSGGLGATSYSYSLNSVPVTPSSDNGIIDKSATFSGLEPGVSKDLIITAINSFGSIPSARFSAYPLTGPPTILNSSAITSAGFTVNWIAPTGASSYTFNITNSAGITVATDSSNLSTSGSNFATFINLTQNTTYNVIVNADNPAPGVTPSTTLQITTAPGPSRPTASSVTGSITSSGFSVNLGGGIGGTGSSTYSFTYTDSSNIRRSISPSDFTNGVATFYGLPAGSSYILHVVAVDSVGSPSPALDFPFTTSPGPAKPVVTTTPITVFSGSATSENSSISITSIPGTIVPYTYILEDTSTSPSTFTTVSSGNPSNGISVVEVGTPPVVTFTGLVSGNTYLVNTRASSLPNAGITSLGFRLAVPIISGGTTPLTYSYTLVNTSTNPSTTTIVSTTSPQNGIMVTETGTPLVATFTGLVSNSNYTVSVMAIDAAGSRSSSSTPVEFTTIPGPAAPVQASIDTTLTSPFAFTIPFTLGAGITPTNYTYSVTVGGISYTINPGTPVNGISITEFSGSPRTARFTGLSAVTTYSVVVNSVDRFGAKTSSSPYTITTLPSTPTQPISLTSPTQGNTTFSLTWSGSLYATSYTYYITTNGVTVNPSISTNIENKSATISGLVAGLTYRVRIMASNSYASSQLSDPIDITTTVFVTTFAVGLSKPSFIITDGSNLYVFQGTTTTKVVKVDSAGNITPIITNTIGNALGMTYCPSRSPPIFLSDPSNNKLWNFDTNGNNIQAANISGTTTFNTGYCTSDSNGNIYIMSYTAPNAGRISAYPSWPLGRYASLLSEYRFFCIDFLNDVYYGNNGLPAVVKYSFLDANTLQTFNNERMYYPIVDNYGNVIYIAQAWSSQFNKIYYYINIIYGYPLSITYNGQTISNGTIFTYAGCLSADSSIVNDSLLSSTFNKPSGLVLSSDNSILYVSDTDNNCIRSMPYVISTIILTLPPTEVTNITLINGSTTSYINLATIQWRGSLQATSYSYTVKDLNNNIVGSVYTDNGIASKKCSFVGLSYGSTYAFTVTAINANGSTSSTQNLLHIPFYIDVISLTGAFFLEKDISDNIYIMQSSKITRIDSSNNKTTYTATLPVSLTNLTYYPPNNSFYFAASSKLYNIPNEQNSTFSIILPSFSYTVSMYNRFENFFLNTPVNQEPHCYTISPLVSFKIFQKTPAISSSIWVNSRVYPSPISGLYLFDSRNNHYRITSNPQNSSYQTLYKYNTFGILIESIDINGPNELRVYMSDFTRSTIDIYGNLVFSSDYYGRVCILYMCSIPFTYNGITFTKGGVYQLLSDVNSSTRICFNNSGSVLYFVGGTNGNMLKSVSYPISMKPTPVSNLLVLNNTTTSLTISWSGGMAATSYSYSMIDSSQNSIPLTIVADTSITDQTVTFSGNFINNSSYSITITATNIIGTTVSDSFPIILSGNYVTTFSSGTTKPAGIAFDSNNLLYVVQQTFSGATVKLMSIASDGVTKTNIITSSGTYQEIFGLCYNPLSDKLIFAATSLNSLNLSAGNSITSLPNSSSVSGCAVDASGNIYFTTIGANYFGRTTTSNVNARIYFPSNPFSSGSHNTSPPNGFGVGLTIDPSGNLWFLSTQNSKVLKVSSSFKSKLDNLTPMAANMTEGLATLLETYGVNSEFKNPWGICSDRTGNIIIADTSNHNIKIIYTNPIPKEVDGVMYTAGNIYTYAGSGAIGNTNSTLKDSTFYYPWAVQLDNTGTKLYVSNSEMGNIRVMPYIV